MLNGAPDVTLTLLPRLVVSVLITSGAALGLPTKLKFIEAPVDVPKVNELAEFTAVLAASNGDIATFAPSATVIALEATKLILLPVACGLNSRVPSFAANVPV